ncbi:class I SAM-dependent methyltransferase [Oceaniradius stylonematis]|jgi:SAM-dependent methyltransferase|uniref:Class I SAM-dependent methyltransferase n=1 Tax=Oceaniradius stylonematis TaxID=2184161 RepID=A0A3A8AFT8_9HYPH|nr:class I SAM-dependent methyltransferase [Oceaniradius stylonematis]RKF06510.1 class I SAM-dependent methyltransferase [Oceaniradius stylonematis]
MGTEQFVSVTEMAGQKVSAEQLLRTCHRYYWARPFVEGGDIAEVACGAGPGLGYLATVAKSVRGGDLSPEVLDRARQVYGDNYELEVFDAASMPYPDRSLDALLLFEAIYYLPDADAFMQEVGRVLRPGGWLLIVTANKDLYDFTPSPHSTRYFGAVELGELCQKHGFDPSLWGYLDTTKVSLRQRVLRPVKLVASRLNLIPGSMAGKVWLKKLFFGSMTEMPGSILDTPHDYQAPAAVNSDEPDRRHKVIYCAARLSEI